MRGQDGFADHVGCVNPCKELLGGCGDVEVA